MTRYYFPVFSYGISGLKNHWLDWRYEKMINTQNDRRWDLFSCQRCGKCCAELGLPYDPKSVFEIAEFLNLKVDQVIEKYYGKIIEGANEWESEDYKRKPCPFLITNGDTKSCLIYTVRPSGCRLYPFDTDFGRSGVDCPGAKIVYEKLNEEEDSQNSAYSENGSEGELPMKCDFDIEVMEPDSSGMLFPPYIKFRIIQLNMSLDCITDGEIDSQIDDLVHDIEILRRTAKKKLKDAQSRHDKILSDKRSKYNNGGEP